MSATKARQIVLAVRPQGKPRLTYFRLEETAIPTPGPGQVLLRVQYLSLDPYTRGRLDDRESYQPPVSLGDVMPGESVATVVASHHPSYAGSVKRVGFAVGDGSLAVTCAHRLVSINR
jgi:NADPH-dependent curcumin reductase CurA